VGQASIFGGKGLLRTLVVALARGCRRQRGRVRAGGRGPARIRPASRVEERRRAWLPAGAPRRIRRPGRTGAAAQRMACARTRFAALIEQAFGIGSAQPVQGEGWVGAVAQQTFTPGTVLGLDARRIVSTCSTRLASPAPAANAGKLRPIVPRASFFEDDSVAEQIASGFVCVEISYTNCDRVSL